MGEAENVVDEEQDITSCAFAAAVTEVLRYGKAAQGHTGTGSWRLVHLTEHQCGLARRQLLHVHGGKVPSAFFHALLKGLAIIDDAGFDHLTEEVVSFTGALTYTGKHGQTIVALGDVVDELHDEDRLADTRTTKQTNLSTLRVRLDQIDHLDARCQDLRAGAQLLELGSGLVNLTRACAGHLAAVDAVNGISGHIEEPALDGLTSRHAHGATHQTGRHTATQPFGSVHGDGADRVFSNVLLTLEDKRRLAFPIDLNGLKDFGQCRVRRETNVHNWTDDLSNGTDVLAHGSEY